jgi:hypothetical protein
MSMEYDSKKSRWVVSPENLGFTIIEFRGPLFSRKQLLDLLLQALKGLIRKELSKAIPKELGLYLRTIERPVTVRGQLDIRGTKLRAIHRKFAESPEALELLGWTEDQAQDFIRMQSKVFKENTFSMKSLGGALDYARYGMRAGPSCQESPGSCMH